MAVWRSVAKFVLMNLTGPFLSEIGESVGKAVGNTIARRIDPSHESDENEEDGDPDEGDSDEDNSAEDPLGPTRARP